MARFGCFSAFQYQRHHNILLKHCKLLWRNYSSESIKSILSQQNIESEISVKGWVKNIRQHKDLMFLHISDGSGASNIQVVITPGVYANKDVSFGSCVHVRGILKESIGQSQKVEILSDFLEVLGPCNGAEFPLKYNTRHPPTYTREYLHLRPKTNFFSALLRIRNAASMAVHNFFQAEDFLFIHTPILTSSDCEGACEVFKVEPLQADLVLSSDSESSGETADGEKVKHFFKQPSYLTVSGQLHLEVMIGAFTKVYNFGPVFRAENSAGSFHLSEFYMIEAELAFIEQMDELATLMEKLVKHVVKTTVDTCPEDFALFLKFLASSKHKNVLKKLMESKYEKMTYTDAIEVLKKSGKKFEYKPEWGCDLKKEHELFLTKEVGELPVFVTDYPAKLKPFYARRNNDGQTVAALDLLAPVVGELCGSSLREERAEVLEPVMKELKLLEQLPWYLELRKFGTCPHGGFGLGFERLLMVMLGADSLKDVIPFPRWPRHCST